MPKKRWRVLAVIAAVGLAIGTLACSTAAANANRQRARLGIGGTELTLLGVSSLREAAAARDFLLTRAEQSLDDYATAKTQTDSLRRALRQNRAVGFEDVDALFHAWDVALADVMALRTESVDATAVSAAYTASRSAPLYDAAAKALADRRGTVNDTRRDRQTSSRRFRMAAWLTGALTLAVGLAFLAIPQRQHQIST